MSEEQRNCQTKTNSKANNKLTNKYKVAYVSFARFTIFFSIVHLLFVSHLAVCAVFVELTFIRPDIFCLLLCLIHEFMAVASSVGFQTLLKWAPEKNSYPNTWKRKSGSSGVTHISKGLRIQWSPQRPFNQWKEERKYIWRDYELNRKFYVRKRSKSYGTFRKRTKMNHEKRQKDWWSPEFM